MAAVMPGDARHSPGEASMAASQAIDHVAEAVWFCRWSGLDEQDDVRYALDRLTSTILSCCHQGQAASPAWPLVVTDLFVLGLSLQPGPPLAAGGRQAYASHLLGRALAQVRAAAR